MLRAVCERVCSRRLHKDVLPVPEAAEMTMGIPRLEVLIGRLLEVLDLLSEALEFRLEVHHEVREVRIG